MIIKKILNGFKTPASTQDTPKTYREELNRQCGLLMLPATLLIIVVWLPYIQLDMNLYPRFQNFIYLRLSMSLTGLMSLNAARAVSRVFWTILQSGGAVSDSASSAPGQAIRLS